MQTSKILAHARLEFNFLSLGLKNHICIRFIGGGGDFRRGGGEIRCRGGGRNQIAK